MEILEEKFRTHYDDNNAVCPYCGYTYQVESEDYDENDREIECSECEKKFWLCQIFSVDHKSTPDCELNGEQHVWSPRSLGGGRTHPFCDTCGKCKPYSRAAVTESEPHT